MSSKTASEEIGESKNRLKIAIVGAGIVGATAAIALSRLPNVSVAVFEASPGAQETGAWISLSVSGTYNLNTAIKHLTAAQKVRHRYVSDRVQYKGAVAYRKVFPESQIADIKGLHNDSSSWRKDGEVMFLSRLGLGQYGVVAIIRETPEVAAKLHWAKNTGVEGLQRLQEHFSTWDPIIGQVLRTMTDIDAYPLDSAPWLEQLVRHDRIAFIGDAAHPTAGAFGLGAALGQGDSWALYRSLQQSYTGDGRNLTLPTGGQTAPEKHYDLRRALGLYNETRRHFLGRVWLQQGLDGVDAAYIAQAASDEAQWIRKFQERHKNQLWMTEHDVEAAFVNTLASEAHWSKEDNREDSVTARL
ncbi:hypothetical protein LAWI1_G001126 [Lachnellula willkommii]|uniref:FAD dependent oxidoreductase domain-containing protein n=1 Tax=Lachnellula willkommii TaxID=215461 RepID=A0A559MKB0_9HELO|nr:hypothetical protein LAWI1_G001126 [Lachnellula willkommii]